MRVVLVDDHRLVRAGLAALLRDIPGVDLVAEAGTGEEAVAIVAETKPDVVFLDLVMPGASGFEALAQICDRQPEVKVIVLSMHSSEEHVLRALRLGAAGYMLKDGAPEELAMALTAVMQGEMWLSPAVSKKVVAAYVERGGDKERVSLLTARQNRVLKLIAEGMSTKEIGVHLGLSAKTIETHRAQIMAKLDIHDVASLARYAVRYGIVPL